MFDWFGIGGDIQWVRMFWSLVGVFFVLYVLHLAIRTLMWKLYKRKLRQMYPEMSDEGVAAMKEKFYAEMNRK